MIGYASLSPHGRQMTKLASRGENAFVGEVGCFDKLLFICSKVESDLSCATGCGKRGCVGFSQKIIAFPANDFVEGLRTI